MSFGLNFRACTLVAICIRNHQNFVDSSRLAFSTPFFRVTAWVFPKSSLFILIACLHVAWGICVWHRFFLWWRLLIAALLLRDQHNYRYLGWSLTFSFCPLSMVLMKFEFFILADDWNEDRITCCCIMWCLRGCQIDPRSDVIGFNLSS